MNLYSVRYQRTEVQPSEEELTALENHLENVARTHILAENFTEAVEKAKELEFSNLLLIDALNLEKKGVRIG